MSDRIDETSGFLSGVTQNSGRKASGEMVDGLESETLIGNPGEKGVLSDGVRVSEEAEILAGVSKSGMVISGTELKSVEFGNLETNDKNDASKNRVVAMASRNNIKWESRVMNMVGRVLDGKLHMDNEVEDVDDPKSGSEVYLVADKDAWQNAISEPTSENKKVNLVGDKDAWQNEIGEPTPENKIEFNRTDNNNGSVMLDSISPAEGSGLNGNQDLITHEALPNVPLKSKRKYNARSGFLMPKSRGENDITEKEGNYYVSDLVWGKVSCHPWWPGQIFSPLSASAEAAVHSKNGAYLIAYFGDRTFAWNNGLKIKPFGMHFSKMNKQSNSEKFCHAVQCALDESARRVELGLSCSCLPPEVSDGIKFQVIENAGILEKASRRAGGDILSGAATFSPGDLLESLESLARSPQSKPDRLQFTIQKAQVLAYNRWKGRYLLPVYAERPCLSNVKEEVQGIFPGPVYEVDNGVSSIYRESTAIDGSSCKRKNLEGGEEEPELALRLTKYKKAAQAPELSEIYSDEQYMMGARNIISSGENHEMVNPIAGKRRGRKPKNLLPIGPNGEAQTEEIPTPDLVLTKLSLLANMPLKGHDAMIPVVGFLHEFRKSACPQTLFQVNDATSSGEQPVFEIGNGVSSKKRKSMARDGFSGKHKNLSGNKQRRKIKEKYLSVLMSSGSSSSVATDKRSVWGGPTNTISSGENCEMVNHVAVDIATNSGKYENEQPSNNQTADTFGIGGFNDSYWTDRVIHGDSQDQVLFKPEADVVTDSNLDDNRKKPIFVDLDPEGPSNLVGEASKEYRPTALLLNFSKLEAIPAIPILNEIFTAYGPLIKSKTKILTKSKRAKVVFRRKEDAETAFSSTGKYKTFGPALISYRLNFVNNLHKNRPTSSKKNKKKKNKKKDA